MRSLCCLLLLSQGHDMVYYYCHEVKVWFIITMPKTRYGLLLPSCGHDMILLLLSRGHGNVWILLSRSEALFNITITRSWYVWYHYHEVMICLISLSRSHDMFNITIHEVTICFLLLSWGHHMFTITVTKSWYGLILLSRGHNTDLVRDHLGHDVVYNCHHEVTTRFYYRHQEVTTWLTLTITMSQHGLLLISRGHDLL